MMKDETGTKPVRFADVPMPVDYDSAEALYENEHISELVRELTDIPNNITGFIGKVQIALFAARIEEAAEERGYERGMAEGEEAGYEKAQECAGEWYKPVGY